MRPFSQTISVAEARRLLLERARPIARAERVPIDEASGRVCAEAVTARADVPPFDRAAMDGYAVHAADTAGATATRPASLRLAGVTYTGDAAATALPSGACVEVATGAPLPAGADAVVMVERTRRAGEDLVEIQEAAHPGQHVGRRGGDITGGTRLFAPGHYLSPAAVGALAAVGLTHVTVRRRPLVVVASTGNEVVAPGQPLQPGHIHDVNRFTLPPVLRAHGAEVRTLPTIPDDLASLAAALDAARDADLVIFTGGSSVGERDLVVDAVTARGGRVVFHGVAMKPGKPTLFAEMPPPPGRDPGGAVPEAPLFLGLSGNPTSCLSNAYVLVVPLLRHLAGLPEWQPQRVTAPLARDITSNARRHVFYPVRIEGGRVAGVFKGSGEITSLSAAVGYIEIPADVERLEAGSMVTVTIF